jgi:hypothetical protein
MMAGQAAMAVMIPKTISKIGEEDACGGDDEACGTQGIELWLKIQVRWHCSVTSCSNIAVLASLYGYLL